MRLLKRIFRPVYKKFIERPLWWFLAKVKAFFMAEVSVQIEQTSQRLVAIEERLRTAEATAEANSIEAKNAALRAAEAIAEASNVALRAVEANNAAQWSSLEQLLLALFHQPDNSGAECRSGATQNELTASALAQGEP